MSDNHQSVILDAASEFFTQLGVSPTLSIAQEEDYYQIQVDTENPALLIGYRGDTLSAIQSMISQQIKHKTGEWHKITVNIGDYKERRQETLQQIAQNAAQRVEFSGEPYVFNGLTPPERRIVHMTLQDNPAVETQSQGEGRSRQLVVVPAN